MRESDTYTDLAEKVMLASYLGTLQARLTDFSYLSDRWKETTESERLLGVSLTGVMDHPVLSSNNDFAEQWLKYLRWGAESANRVLARKIGIRPAAAITCIKPEGTVSQLTDTASGLHPRWSDYYIRRVRMNMADPLSHFLAEQGVPWELSNSNSNDAIFSFPQKSPDGAVTRKDMGAIAQLEHWLMLQRSWCEHKPSITVYYSDDEFFAVCQWIWDHFDEMSGIALLPRDDAKYDQAPYEDIDEETYHKLVAAMPAIDWTAFRETEDNTVSSQTFACVGANCEVL